MLNNLLPKELLRRVKPRQVRAYAIAKGWRRVPDVNGLIALFDHPKSAFDQLIVPLDDGMDDYPRRIRDVVAALAEFESRPEIEILNDLLTPESDILRYRVASQATGRSSIPLNQGIRLLEGAKRSILAAACAVVNPITHHPRMSLSEAQQLLNACELGQTERRSYGVSIACPLRAVEQDQSLLPNLETFARRAVATLMVSLSRLITAIETDEISKIHEHTDDQPVLSSNLCDGLLLMQPAEEDSSLDIQVSWASTLSPREGVPAFTRIRHEAFSVIADVSKELRAAQPQTASLFVGHVEDLRGEPDADGRMQGEATLSVVHEDQLQSVRVALNPENWQIAHAAFGEYAYVKFRGVLYRGMRSHRIVEVNSFEKVN